MSEIVDLEKLSSEGKTPPEDALVFKVKIDKKHYTIEQPIVTGLYLLELSGVSPIEKYELLQFIRGNEPILIKPEDEVDLRKKGIERFSTRKKDVQDG